MGWRAAKSLLKLKDQINNAYPNRVKVRDGMIGDEAHKARASDHNENADGVVCAADFTHDPDNGFDAHAHADFWLLNRHSNLKYIISNRRIAGYWTDWRWVPYSGASQHTNYVHVSVGVGPDGKSGQPYDDTDDWAMPASDSVTPAPSAPISQVQTVTLPASVKTWAAYTVGSAYRKGTSDQVGTLLPSKYGGLTYDIVENRGNVVVIDTQAYGRVAIWVQGTEAMFGGGMAPSQPSQGGHTVTFPAHTSTWRVYKVGSAYRKDTSDQIGVLKPSKFGGLTYPIVENRGNVVIIDTKDYGRVAAWVKDTDAVIR